MYFKVKRSWPGLKIHKNAVFHVIFYVQLPIFKGILVEIYWKHYTYILFV